MNKFVKNIIIFTVISFSTIIVKSDSKEETSQEIIYDYYDTSDEILSTKVENILQCIDEHYDIDTFNVDSEEDIKSILLLNAVIENGKLTNDEKELCYSLLPFYLDYDNLDRKGIYERLSTLDIIYIDEEVKVSATEVKGASYIPDSNIIICHNKKNIILKHELFHVSIPMTDFPKVLKEGLVSELTKEYFYNENAKFSSTYREYMALINSFTYLIDSDTLIELASFNDLERFKEILLNKGYITENELDDIISLFDKQLGIKDRTKIVEKLLESYDVLRNNPGALESLKVYNLYDSSKSADYYFNKSKMK